MADSEYLDTSAPIVLPSVFPSHRTDIDDDRDDEDRKSDGELLDELLEEEADFDWGGFREARMQQIKEEAQKRLLLQNTLHGRYTEIKNEKELITTASKEPYCIIHFFHRDFRRCKIMDRHLEKIAPAHPSTLFLKADVTNVPWLVQKMSVKVLPCVICFVGGAAKDKIVGFEDLSSIPGKEDEFQSGALELRFKHSGVIPKPGAPLPGQLSAVDYNFTNTAFARQRRAGASESGGIRQAKARAGSDDSGSDRD
ncbi:ATP binding protein [Phaffia rhodozyma]|uniref:ATP binding protein n=1 Tax=Phaffia rhodozyma TaxID=264483 RepID=A0A0F7SS05_PHARH|nr:ATP binding protein [Phaffia rhodozyma]